MTIYSSPLRVFGGLAIVLLWAGGPVICSAEETLRLHLRQRVADESQQSTAVEEKARQWKVVEPTTNWEPHKTAIVVCDMWDRHWCENATKRVAEMAPRMNEVLVKAREQGVLIIHCPSDTMEFYKDYPQRKLAQAAPVVEPVVPLQRWCHIDSKREPPLPIDDSQGGCDDSPSPASSRAWKKQHDALEIQPKDAITDSAEAYYLMKQRGIENVIVMGVHTNMCVLGRPFSIRQMVYQGMNVVLMRDMTDAMYDPDAAPQVSHARGTDLVIAHIEKYWCPSITSSDFTGKPPFSFSDDKRPHVVFMVGEDEYDTQTSLPQLVARELEPREYRCTFVYADEEDKNLFPLAEDIVSADLLFLSVRRRLLTSEQLELVRKYVASGKPIVAIRTSSHAFAARGDAPIPEGHATWPDFDTEVLGGKYQGHFAKAKSGPSSQIWINPDASHSLVDHFPDGKFDSGSWLYKYENLAPDTQVLLWGQSADAEKPQPVAWIRDKNQRIFYTMMGQKLDFDSPPFLEMLHKAVAWGLKKRD